MTKPISFAVIEATTVKTLGTTTIKRILRQYRFD